MVTRLCSWKINWTGEMSRGWETPNLSWTWRKKTLEAQLTWPGRCITTRWVPVIRINKLLDPMLEALSGPRFQMNGSQFRRMIEFTIKRVQLWSIQKLRVTSVPTGTAPELLTERWRWLTRSPASYRATTICLAHATRIPLRTCFTQRTRRVSRTCLLQKLIENTRTRLMWSWITVSQCTDSEPLLHLLVRQQLLSERRQARSEDEHFGDKLTNQCG